MGGGVSGDMGEEVRYNGRAMFRVGRARAVGGLVIVSLGLVGFFLGGLDAFGGAGGEARMGERVS